MPMGTKPGAKRLGRHRKCIPTSAEFRVSRRGKKPSLTHQTHWFGQFKREKCYNPIRAPDVFRGLEFLHIDW